MFLGRHKGVGFWVLTALTAALAAGAAVNGLERYALELPSDGATWVDTEAGVLAARIDPEGPAAQVGVRPGDLLRSINRRTVGDAADAARLLDRAGVWSRAHYEIERDGIRLGLELVVAGEKRGPAQETFQGVLAAVFLILGGFVLFREKRVALEKLFYAFCLSAFAVFGFSYSGSLGGFDRWAYWVDVWATALMPALLLHFAAAFPRGRMTSWGRGVAVVGYAAAAAQVLAYHGLAGGWFALERPLSEVSQLLDRMQYGLLGAGLLIAPLLLIAGRKAADPAEGEQRRWMAAGTFWGAAPFVAFYVAPFVAGLDPGPNHSISIFSLALIPTAFLFAMARYRLMDVDLVVRRGTAYTLATIATLALFYAGAFLLSGWIDPRGGGLGPATWVFSVVMVGLLFHPLRSWIQQALDRRYYRERYDYRRTLADFAAELGAETDADRMLGTVRDRLRRTLDLERMEIFVGDERRLGRFTPWDSTGRRAPDFLSDAEPRSKRRYLFFENPDQAGGAAAEWAFYYYVPCTARGRVVAWLGLGRIERGVYLSSEDLALVEAVSGNVAAALENARLYRTLETKAEEFQRLKDYNENIVESLHVGILATDLDDRVESWNTQLELMFGISRTDAVGRKLGELLPAELLAECERVRDEAGIHNLYQFGLRASALPEEFRPPAGSADAARERTLNIAIAPLVAKNFAPIGRLIILDDVTERTALEQQVVQADKLSSIGLLAAGVAHEVNTPLAVISSYAQMLAKQVDGDPAREKALQKITQQTFRASEIVNSLLNFSRTASNEFVEVSLNDVVTETLALIEPQLAKAGVRVATNLAADAPRVRGVKGKLQQVLLNLFLNARDVMADGGELRVTTETDGEAARIRVADTGPGVGREQAAKIFDPFFTTKGGQGGTGLGLSVSYGIIKEHAGSLTLEENPGAGGAAFRIELPLVGDRVHA